MPYVKCPSCELVSYSAAAYAALELCPHCGAGLPLRRVVVSLVSQPRPPVGLPAEPPSPARPLSDARARGVG
jgi:hypothetical protein